MNPCMLILILSGFTTGNKCVTTELATRGNEFVAADEQKILSGNARQLFRL